MGFDVALILALAFIIDALWGEPGWIYRRLPHPVVLMSDALMMGEKWLNNPAWSRAVRYLTGSVLALAAVALMYCIGIGFEHILTDSIWGYGILVLITSTMLAGRSLYDHVRDVGLALEQNNIETARRAVSQIIGRDPTQLDEPAIARAALESLSENFSDGIVAPAFWFLIGGLPGILIYKMVNTADSMIGNRSERFETFGWAAARLDDVLNLIPARLTALLFALASLPFGRAHHVLGTAWRDAGKHLSPNAGWPEAAFAAALEIRLGGPRRYPGNVIVDGVWLGSGGEATSDHITRGLKLALISWELLLCATLIWGMQ